MREEFLIKHEVQTRDKKCIVLAMFAPGQVFNANTGEVKQTPQLVKYDPKMFNRIRESLNGYKVFEVVHVPPNVKLEIPFEVIHDLVQGTDEQQLKLIPAKYRMKPKEVKKK